MVIYSQLKRYYDVLLKEYQVVWSRWCSPLLSLEHSGSRWCILARSFELYSTCLCTCTKLC